MPKHRKFNIQKFFDAFEGSEDELADLYRRESFAPPDPFTLESARQSVIDADSGEADSLIAKLHELNDLATPIGRELVEQAASAFDLGNPPGEDVPHQRVACWLYLTNPDAFEHAQHLLAARTVRGKQIAVFPGREPRQINDIGATIAELTTILQDVLPQRANTERFEVRHYMDGEMLVILVFCERTAEVQLEFEGTGQSVQSTIRRPVSQDVLFYNQQTGELEIEAGRPKHREILRSSFARAAFRDETFFPREEHTRVLNLRQVARRNFELPVGSGHSAKITGIKVTGYHPGSRFSFQFMGGRANIIEILESYDAIDMIQNLQIDYVRIELILETGRRGRKVIELRGDNRIKFNRESHSDEVYSYLKNWGLMRSVEMAEQSAV